MIFKGSRFTNTPAYIDETDGTLLIGIRSRATFDMTEAQYYTFIQGDTIDGIAYREYGDASLYWAILDANPEFQHEVEIKPGDTLAIPPYNEVVKWL